jgi:two-component system, OmpR family, sensor histidine kinase BaeS
MRFSLSVKIIMSMAAVVFINALICYIVALLVITNQTREFETRLDQMRVEIQNIMPQPEETLQKVKAIVNNEAISAERRIQELFNIVHLPAPTLDKVKEAAKESGLPISETTPAQIAYTVGIQISPVVEFFANPAYRILLIASVISMIFAVTLGTFLSRAIVRPVRALEYASERIANGNYSLVIKPEGKDDLGRLAASFNKMSLALRQTEKRRKDLVADLSHELSTPLSGIQGYTEALRDGLVKTDERRNCIYDHILSEIAFLTTMVNSIKQWAVDEQTLEQLRLAEIGIESVLQNISNRFATRAESQKIKLTYLLEKSTHKVYADPNVLNQILSNLVDNALRYTPAGGTVQIKVTGRAKSKQILFEVSDTGCGIAEEHLPHIFERFYRVDESRGRDTGGSGLGLAIVREAVQVLGGDLKMESTIGVGTQVYFRLPEAENRG